MRFAVSTKEARERVHRLLLEQCDDTKFAKGYRCTAFVDHEPNESPTDLLYLAVRGKEIVGGVVYCYARNRQRRVDGVVLTVAATATASDATLRGTGTRLLEFSLADLRKDTRVRWVFIHGASESGTGMYMKAGFKQLGRDGAMVLKLRGAFPGAARLAYLLAAEGWSKEDVARSLKQWRREPDVAGASNERFKATRGNFHVYTPRDSDSRSR